MPTTLYGAVSTAAMLLISGVAVGFGRGWTRSCALLLLIGIPLYVWGQDRVHWSNQLTLPLLVDGVQLCWFLIATSRTGSLWLTAAAAFELLDVAAHAGVAVLRHSIGPFFFVVAVQAWDWGVYLSILMAALTHSGATTRAASTPVMKPH